MLKRRRRSLSHILADVEALKADALWNVIGTLTHCARGEGVSTCTLVVDAHHNRPLILHLLKNEATRCIGGNRRLWRELLLALWVQDNPDALINPSWAPSVCVRGDTSD